MRHGNSKLRLAAVRTTLIASALVATAWCRAEAAAETFDSYAAFAQSSVPQDILWKVLARNGKSKNYTQVFALDGGTVGIANFAVGGLANLYKLMDTQKYFGRSREEMIDNYSDKCRPGKHKGNDTGWGCYSQKWWREGMVQFVNSPESHDIQNKAWLTQMRPTVELALQHGWNDSRSLAIATGVANSIGGGGFSELAKKYGWRAEEVLSGYVGKNDHRKRRRDAINAAFPP
ncbi:hypothetical protein EN866_33730 [Mesorhizobium sp. M2D.F.Ca.ET.223.01.1.1]|uniref:hypothetical protein n=1 Tax=Mesorhizobium sp. M2D.F.Ca.ET.223.01.1.1 TaxID=2563940 RepID=UPI001092023F|nr:hypothetical protein [Mesorhizobium sp. M2D.F.Ca.ET.223.01.1.1]TGR83835.1 hypothetical protein EN866_33730 [Mesorhizobium sp. M2D.F.Ca.ET.223.01.1.1]TGT78415.1 hypothetical protein EN802_01870 [bacterium M00.F.Ca.ET.159.01.1.1]TGT89082.1 hypothetical protein EN800_01870 [bacterium M00.F.Ca.ET.157.01.1.1]